MLASQIIPFCTNDALISLSSPFDWLTSTQERILGSKVLPSKSLNSDEKDIDSSAVILNPSCCDGASPFSSSAVMMKLSKSPFETRTYI